MSIIKMTDLNLSGKRVLIYSDLNVPIKNGNIISDVRIKASLPTINLALKNNAKVILASHLGRPIEGIYDEKLSLLPIVNYLKNKISVPVRLVKDYLNGIKTNIGELVVLENVRFNVGEKSNNELLSKKYANLCDIFIMDAFGAAHRMYASTYGIINFVKTACAGLLLISELDFLSRALNNPVRPMVAVVGGSKISTKITILNSLSKIADQIIVGGGIANTLIAASGYNIGKSIYEKDLLDEAKRLIDISCILIPTDVCVTNEFSRNANATNKVISKINFDEQILDLGKNTIQKIIKILENSKTVLWNGPVGVFEFPNFRNGTEKIARTIAKSNIFSIAGGGDTIAAIDMFDISDKISYISTGGGSFLRFIENKTLPVIEMLKNFSTR